MEKSSFPTKEKLQKFAMICVASIGVVFGDIGTSPIYALRECFAGDSLPVNMQNVLGIVSLILWSLLLVVSVKYLIFLFKADNRGEGGILALITLLSDKHLKFIVPAGIFGAALLYGDGIITPSISVLSAIEGLNVASDIFEKHIVYIAILILVALFMIQKNGTARIGVFFGPVLILWFLTIGFWGSHSILQSPEVLNAFNPLHAAKLFIEAPSKAFFILGAVFLALTGAEVLYADMGHFGKNPIRASWFTLALPCLLLNYMGQGASLIRDPETVNNLFYRIVPDFFLYPMIILATMATVIASQAVITGTFSLVRQAIQLGFWPRMTIIHTSKDTIGQVYLPEVNWLLFAGTVILVLIFKDSGKLAAAYGTAVSATMLITTILATIVAKRLWSASNWIVFPIAGFFLTVDLAFFSSNAFKIPHGGWIPLLLGFLIYVFSGIWQDGRRIMRENVIKCALSYELFIKSILTAPPLIVKGTSVFLSGNLGIIPRSLLHNLKHNKILHENTIILNVVTEEVPFMKNSLRSSHEKIHEGIYRVTVRYGFSEIPDIPGALNAITDCGIDFRHTVISYFLGKESIVINPKSGMAPWKKRIFVFMSRNSYDVTKFFHIPVNQVTEFGIQVEL